MAKSQHPQLPVRHRLKGKNILFFGRIDADVQTRLEAVACAQGATVVDELDAGVTHLILATRGACKGAQREARALNATGARIQIIDVPSFQKLIALSNNDVRDILHAGRTGATFLEGLRGDEEDFGRGWESSLQTVTSVHATSVDISKFDLGPFIFSHCDFRGCKGDHAVFSQVRGCRFSDAELPGVKFYTVGDAVDFTRAYLSEAEFVQYGWMMKLQRAAKAVIFRNAKMVDALFDRQSFLSPDFSHADLRRCRFSECRLPGAKFNNANLSGIRISNCSLRGADFTGANLTGADLGTSDLASARFYGANLKDCRLRGANLQKVDLRAAKHVDPHAIWQGRAGPALAELARLNKKTKRIAISFDIRHQGRATQTCIHLTPSLSRDPLDFPAAIPYEDQSRYELVRDLAAVMAQLARILAHQPILLDSVGVTGLKCPRNGRYLQNLVVAALAEIMGQPIPTLAERDAMPLREFQGTIPYSLDERIAMRRAAQREQTLKIKALGKLSDLPAFLKALALRIEQPKIDKALQMFKKTGFDLYSDQTETFLNGIVKSQTDKDLIYACRIKANGYYCCCTQNMNACGGLRGSICKHLLALIIGLVNAGKLDPAAMDTWVAKSRKVRPELEKEVMAELFIKYKGAEAGTLDWRPTETLPEDYYAL